MAIGFFQAVLRKPFLRAVLLFSIIVFIGCEKQRDSIVDSIGVPPALLRVELNPTSINSDSINVGSTRSPSDTLPIALSVSAIVTDMTENPASYVGFVLRNPSSGLIVSSGQLYDDGTGLDRIKGDGTFSGKPAFKITRVEIGTFRVEVCAVGRNGFQSNTIIAPLTIYRGNRAPALSVVDVPDTLTLAHESQSLALHIKATDPDGTADIARVIFNSFKPDGSPSGGNPFQMYDDGSTTYGDATAGDGIYSLIITLPPNTTVGTYTFKFQAFDRSAESSPIIVHRVTVKQ
jgi:hypothetical protein